MIGKILTKEHDERDALIRQLLVGAGAGEHQSYDTEDDGVQIGTLKNWTLRNGLWDSPCVTDDVDMETLVEESDLFVWDWILWDLCV